MNRRGSLISRFGAATLVAALFLAAWPIPAEAAVIRPFTPRFTTNTTGAITLTGNTLLTCPASATSCVGARMGTGAANVLNDNYYSMVFVDIDSDATTFNSSRNTLSIPATSTVLWAGLYWGADTTAGASGGTAAPNAAARNQIRFAPPGSSYSTVTASQLDSSPVTGGFRYQGFANVTSEVAASRSGEYTVANLQAGRGADRYGGWALVVAYQDINEPVRNLTVFDGYAVVQQTPAADQNVAIPVSGFLTPPTGPVRSRVGVVAYEGDLGLVGDSLRLNSTSLTNSLNPATNFFNSSLTSFNGTITAGDPFYTNMMGFDVDTIRADGVLANGATSATINLNTNNDTYFPGVVSFSTELFAPRLELAKSVVDLNGGQLDPGDEVLYTVQVTNDGDDAAGNVILTDPIPDYATYVPGSLLINGLPVTDAVGDDTGNIAAGPARIIARLGTGATPTTGGTIPIGATRTVSFRVTVGSIPADGALSNMATATYVGATSGLPLIGVSNEAALSPAPRSDLSLLKFGPAAPVTLPGSVAYQLIVVNRGPSAEPAATVTDVLPPGFTSVTASSTRGSCVVGASVVCNLGSLAVGDSAIVDIAGTVTTGSGIVTNTATVTGSNVDPFPNNNSDRAVTDLNNPPVAVNQAVSTPSNTAIIVSVLAGATDPDSDSLGVANVGTAANGSVVVNIDGTTTYLPNFGFKGVDSFDFTISDGRGGFDTATVTVTVANAPPVAVDDFAATPPGTAVILDVLDNDSDPNGDPFTVQSVTQPVGGAATGDVVFGPGSVTFTPAAAFRGIATFTYTISDGTDTSTATVSVEVPDASPAAVDDAVDTPSNTSVVIPVLNNDIDPNGDPISVVFGSLSVPVNGGTAVLNLDGTVTYTPPFGFRGIDSFTYTITDGLLTSTATVYVNVLNAPPVANADAVTTPPGTAIDIPVLANDTDPNGDSLSVIGVGPPSSGLVALNLDGTVSYTPLPGFKGLDIFTYTISDGFDTSSATVSVTVPNTPPSGANDARTTAAGTPVTVPVLANDYDANGDSLSVSAVTSPANGTAVINPDGSITYTPNSGFAGIDRFTYTVTDGTNGATATVTITVQNAPPVAVDDLATTTVGIAVVVPVLDNDTDANGDNLTVLVVSDPSNGTALVNADGTVTYTPNPGFVGDDSFTYTMTDGPDTSTATVTITVENRAPVAADDSASTPAGAAVTVSVLANDFDPDGQVLSVVSVTQPANGSVVINGAGTVTYTPDPGFSGTETFTYTISDGIDSDSAMVTITVQTGTVNRAPVAANDAASTPVDTPATVPVLTNDFDPDGDQLSVVSVTQPSSGTAVINMSGTVTYTPNPGFSGVEIFTYTISDGIDTSTATVTITVQAGLANGPPVAADDAATTVVGTPVAVPVLANDSDPDGDALLVDSVTQPASGSAAINGDDTVTYTPDPGFVGTDTFTYTVSDGIDSVTATVVVTVTAAATPGDSPDLARTGLDVLPWFRTGLLLIGGGWAIVFELNRRRRLTRPES